MRKSPNVVTTAAYRFVTSTLIETAWAFLRQPWPLIACSAVVVFMLLGSMLLPQLPGQLVEEPATAARWLTATSAEFAPMGAVFRSLGLFAVMHSPLLRVLLALIGLMLFVHLADLVGVALAVRNLDRLLDAPVNSPGEPLPAPRVTTIHRLRKAQVVSPAIASAALFDQLVTRFATVRQKTLPAEPTGHGVQEETEAATLPDEHRLLARRHTWAAYLRPLLILGWLLALWAVWLIATLGWQVAPSTLAPGDTYHYTPHNLELGYSVEVSATDETRSAPSLHVKIGESVTSLPATIRSHARLGAVDIHLQPGAPGLLISTTTGRPELARPGQNRSAPSVGLVFPRIGSEESVLMPNQATGLRIVRSSTDPQTFLVEVYRSFDVQPVKRLTIADSMPQMLEMDDGAVSLQFWPLPGVDVQVSYRPGLWLLWSALGVSLIGAIGYVRRPAFVLAQVSAWPRDRSLVVVQSNVQDEIERLTAPELDENPQAATPGQALDSATQVAATEVSG